MTESLRVEGDDRRPFVIPESLVDPAQLPPPIATSDPGSFARYTFLERVPTILQEAVAFNKFSGEPRRGLEGLLAEVAGGKIREISEQTPDRTFWNTVSEDYIGRSWLDVPWYWAEAYLYRRVLEATGYFRPGPRQGHDPFAANKTTELVPEAAPAAVEQVIRQLSGDPADRFRLLLYASLWGNRIDLSYKAATQVGRAADPGESNQNVLADDAANVWGFLNSRQARTIAVLADNAGTELLMDFLLIHELLDQGLAQRVDLHVKEQPFFVSDAMAQDVEHGLRALETGGVGSAAVARSLRGHLAATRLTIHTHWHYTTSLFYFQIPDGLRQMLSSLDLVIVKGDANYRRLLGDAHWPPTASFEVATRYFPAPLVALRTLKAEIIVGLPSGLSERLDAEDPSWRVNGKRGLVQSRL